MSRQMGQRRRLGTTIVVLCLAGSAGALTAQPPARAGEALILPPQNAQGLDTAAAVAGLADLAAACRSDGSVLWGVPLCGPTLLVDRGTRTVIASGSGQAGFLHPLAGHPGIYSGRLPDSVGLANTSVDLGGTRWAMILLPLPRDRYERVKLMVHESFHRVQPGLGLWGRDPANAQLDEREGRIWLRLELHALARALMAAYPTGVGDAGAHDTTARARAGRPSPLPSVRAALLFRAYRHALYPGADTLEAQLERQEGLAEYTGARVALDLTHASIDRVTQDMMQVEGRPTYVRSFAYATGPALGLLLDRFRPDWRSAVREHPDMAALLAEAVHSTPPGTDSASVRALGDRARALATVYDGATIIAQEDARERERQARLAVFQKRFVDGPVLVVQQQGASMSFDPNQLVPFGDRGTVYTVATFTGPWGKLVVTSGGALLSSDFTRITVPAPTDTAARPLTGDGWSLELRPDWVLRGSEGDWEVVRRGGEVGRRPRGVDRGGRGGRREGVRRE